MRMVFSLQGFSYAQINIIAIDKFFEMIYTYRKDAYGYNFTSYYFKAIEIVLTAFSLYLGGQILLPITAQLFN